MSRIFLSLGLGQPAVRGVQGQLAAVSSLSSRLFLRKFDMRFVRAMPPILIATVLCAETNDARGYSNNSYHSYATRHSRSTFNDKDAQKVALPGWRDSSAQNTVTGAGTRSRIVM